jgi:hypothetical protein
VSILIKRLDFASCFMMSTFLSLRSEVHVFCSLLGSPVFDLTDFLRPASAAPCGRFLLRFSLRGAARDYIFQYES